MQISAIAIAHQSSQWTIGLILQLKSAFGSIYIIFSNYFINMQMD